MTALPPWRSRFTTHDGTNYHSRRKEIKHTERQVTYQQPPTQHTRTICVYKIISPAASTRKTASDTQSVATGIILLTIRPNRRRIYHSRSSADPRDATKVNVACSVHVINVKKYKSSLKKGEKEGNGHITDVCRPTDINKRTKLSIRQASHNWKIHDAS